LAVAHIGQGAAFDHAQGVFEVSALGVSTQVVALGGRTFRGVGGDQVSHVFKLYVSLSGYVIAKFRHCEEQSDEAIQMASLRSP
jgi:hypothetical protein